MDYIIPGILGFTTVGAILAIYIAFIKPPKVRKGVVMHYKTFYTDRQKFVIDPNHQYYHNVTLYEIKEDSTEQHFYCGIPCTPGVAWLYTGDHVEFSINRKKVIAKMTIDRDVTDRHGLTSCRVGVRTYYELWRKPKVVKEA